MTLNEKVISSEIKPNLTLLDFLRSEGFFSVKRGCESGECGSCTVLIDGIPKASCITLTIQTDERIVTTVEALATREELSDLQKRFVEVGAIQCGYCTPALLLVAEHFLTENPKPSEKEVRDAISGVLCRCTGYVKPVEAILNKE
ncbi:MAG: (2Fe-2S)-binding protein [Candidatus Marinimicrobia bacterium]|nr:(2Fe-2S)-binding protein [Candidatus Neomarinimicrobiota bacterium]